MNTTKPATMIVLMIGISLLANVNSSMLSYSELKGSEPVVPATRLEQSAPSSLPSTETAEVELQTSVEYTQAEIKDKVNKYQKLYKQYQKKYNSWKLLIKKAAPCKNRYSLGSCQGWKKAGYCKRSYVSWMKINCNKTCGYCRQVGDKSAKCKNWAKKGYCIFNHYNYMIDNCKESCGLMKKDTDKYCYSWTKSGYCESSKYRKRLARTCNSSCGSDCKDKNNNCEHWTKNGYCNSNSSYRYMAYNCPKSCGHCCKDFNSKCPSMAKNGKCNSTNKADKEYMKYNCAKSCGKCCYDNFAKCSSWAKEGRCTNSHKDMMNKYCKRSCRLCK